MSDIVRGETFQLDFALVDANGAVVSMVSAARSLVYCLTPRGSSDVALRRTTGVSGQYSWTTQASGIGSFLFPYTVTDALDDLGECDEDVWYLDTSTSPETRRLVYRGTRRVRTSKANGP